MHIGFTVKVAVNNKKEYMYTYDQVKDLLKRGTKASKRNPNKFQFLNYIRVNFIIDIYIRTDG